MVEWKTLGEIANLVRGRVISKDYIRDNSGDYPVYSSQTANDGVLGCIDTYMFDGAYLTWTTDGAYAGTIFKRKGKFNITNVCGLIDVKTNENILQEFLYYWLSLTAKRYVSEGMGNPKLMSNVASTIKIPIPSKEEQTRIVEILDTFTASIANLKEQIKERRKQYEYYRDQLLDLEGKDGVKWKTLGDIANLVRGRVISKDYIRDNSGEYPVYSSQTANDGILGCIDTYMFDGAYLTWTTDGAYAGTIFRRKGKFNITNVCGLIDVKTNENILQAFLYYWLSLSAKRYVSEGMGNPKLMSNVASTIKIPIPSKEEQLRIVTILDQFEASIANLEAQLKEREKQYEYYRNQLLTFE